MVECEYKYFLIHATAFLVLIDTWWNVNIVFIKFLECDKQVLIDTWWNVNI